MDCKKNLLVTLADKSYLDTAKHFFAGAYFNSGWQGDYMLLAHDMPNEDLSWFSNKGIIIKHCQPLLSFLPQKWPPVVLDKFYLFTSEFKKWQNVIYLDSDMMIKGNLDALTQTEGFAGLNIKPFFKRTELKEYFDRTSIYFNPQLFEKIRSEYDLNAMGFRGGIFAFNTAVISDRLFPQIIELMPILKFSNGGEEIILNLIFNNKWERIPFLYNINPVNIKNLCGIRPENQRAIVFHFDEKRRLLMKNHPLCREYESNSKQADLIDLSHRQAANNIWTKAMINNYRLYLYLRYVLHLPHYWTDRFFGLIGIYLSGNQPRLYGRLKKLMNY